MLFKLFCKTARRSTGEATLLQLFVDGCYELNEQIEPADFWVATPPTAQEIEDTLSKLQASSVTYRFASGKSKGKKAMVLKSGTDNDHTATKALVAKNFGFSLHAGVATKAHERDRLEKFCRYIARPAVSEKRLSTNDQGDVIYRFKKPGAKGCYG